MNHGPSWIPGHGLLRILLAWFGLAIAAVAWPATGLLWQGAALALVGMVAVEAWRLRKAPELEVDRFVPEHLPLGEWTEVRLRLRSTDQRPMHLEVHDHYPTSAELKGLPRQVELAAEQQVEVTYLLRPRRRGEFRFDVPEIWRRPQLDLLRRRHRVGEGMKVRVLPNFRPILNRGLAGLETRMARHGMHLQRRRGEGMEFQQLRDFRRGDSLRQVDWKATARRSKLISRQYEDERNQQVVLLLDCGRRMHAREGDLTHFDHVLNASLLLAYVAVRQGDAVGVGAFGGEERWLPPMRGIAAPQQVLEVIHDLQTSTEAPDFPAAAARLMQRQRRRALVVLVTNLRDEDEEELLPAIKTLRRRHLVLVASTRERALLRLRDQGVKDFETALEVGAAHHYLEARRKAHEVVRGAGAFVLDVEPQEMPLALAARYLEIKRAGQL